MFPDAVLLGRMEERAVYADRKSHEFRTGVVKLKYKLYCSHILDIYVFLVGTSKHSYCELDVTLWVRYDEWEDRNPQHFGCETTYFDIGKSETLTAKEIIDKSRDSSNGLPKVGFLPESKKHFLENLVIECKKKHFIKRDISKMNNVIRTIIKDDEVAKDILNELGL